MEEKERTDHPTVLPGSGKITAAMAKRGSRRSWALLSKLSGKGSSSALARSRSRRIDEVLAEEKLACGLTMKYGIAKA
jgi:hypothetical protein